MSTTHLEHPSTALRSPRFAAFLGAIALLSLAGCAESTGDDDSDDELVGEASEAFLAAAPNAFSAAITTPANSRTQSESAIALGTSNGVQNIVVAYNDETNTEANITYTPTDRVTCTGASMAGFSYSLDSGATWTKGTKLTPPSGWAILWGDPAAAGSPHNPSYVFFSTLAAPNAKWPVSGCWSGSFGDSGTPLGGACIARSSNGGKNFSFSASQPCLSNQNHFYDGGAMAVAPNGTVYAAFQDVDTGKIDVWSAPSETANFTLIANTPFPGVTIGSHPRIKATSDNKVMVVAQSITGALYINKLATSSTWGAAQFAGLAALYPGVTLSAADDPNINIRTGPQFSFDIGAASAAGNDQVRILYAYRNQYWGNVLQLDVTLCNLNATVCQVVTAANPTGFHYPPSGWPNNTGDVFNPQIAAAGSQWKMTFLSREMYIFGTDRLAMLGADLRQTASHSLTNIAQISVVERPCPDLRGYWGDYDLMIGIGPDAAGKQRFLRPMSDSTGASCTRWQYKSDPLHLTAFRFL